MYAYVFVCVCVYALVYSLNGVMLHEVIKLQLTKRGIGKVTRFFLTVAYLLFPPKYVVDFLNKEVSVFLHCISIQE